jgi:hypothetical protein
MKKTDVSQGRNHALRLIRAFAESSLLQGGYALPSLLE